MLRDLLKMLQTPANNALVLVILLITGTISSIYPLYIEEAQAESYYKLENSYKPRYSADSYKNYQDSSISIEKIECINTNLNINGIHDDIINGPQRSVIDEKYGQKLNGKLSGYNNEERNKYGFKQDNKDSAFVCIYNNTNDVQINKPNGNGKIPEPLTCEECFITSLTKEQLDRISTATLSLSEGELSFEEICKILSDKANDDYLTNEDKIIIFNAILDRANIPSQVRTPIIDCLEELGIIKLS